MARDPGAPGPPSVAPSWLRELAEGFLRPSRLGFGVMVATFLLGVAVVCWFFSTPVLSGPLGRFLARSDWDAEARATYRALQLRRDPPDQPQLLILGSSAVANAIASEQQMQAALYQSTGQHWSVTILATPAQSVFDQLTLINTALGPPPGPRRPVVIAIEMSLLRERASLARTLELEQTGRLGVRSDWTDQAVRDLGGKPRSRIGDYLVDNFNFLALRGDKVLMRLLLGRPAVVRIDRFAPRAPLPVARRQRAKIMSRLRALRRGSPLVYVVTEKLFGRLRPYPHVQVVFIEAKLSPDFTASMRTQQMEAGARADAQRFAQANGAEYWPIVSEAAVPSSAYFDDLHIATAPDQARVRAALANHLADYVRRKGVR